MVIKVTTATGVIRKMTTGDIVRAVLRGESGELMRMVRDGEVVIQGGETIEGEEAKEMVRAMISVAEQMWSELARRIITAMSRYWEV